MARFEDKIEEMRSQNLFTPHAIVVDGFPFDAAHHALLKRIKAFAVKNGFYIWFSVRTHRHEQADAEGTPPQLQGIDDLFDAIFGLKSAEQAVQLFHIKGGNAAKKQHVLFLDPATMLVKKGR